MQLLDEMESPFKNNAGVRAIKSPLCVLAVLVLVLTAYGVLAFNHTLVGDDWDMLHRPKAQYETVFRNGRWLEVFIWRTLGDNVAAVVTLNLNRRDLAVANRIMHAIEAHEKYAILRKNGWARVYAIGSPKLSGRIPFAASPAPGPMDGSIIQCGMKGQTYRLESMLNTVGSDTVTYHMHWFQEKYFRENKGVETIVLGHAKHMKEWPQDGSVVITAGGDVILLFDREQGK